MKRNEVGTLWQLLAAFGVHGSDHDNAFVRDFDVELLAGGQQQLAGSEPELDPARSHQSLSSGTDNQSGRSAGAHSVVVAR